MADKLEIEITGLEDLIKRLSPEEAEAGLRNGMQVAVLRGRRQLTKNLSGKILKRRTGTMAGAISTEVQSDGNEVTGIITHTARWRWRGREGSLLEVHEKGATIKPREGYHYTLVGDRIVRSGGILRFEVGGKTIFARKVVIPARRPLGTTLDEIKDDVINDVKQGLVRKLNGEPPLGSGA